MNPEIIYIIVGGFFAVFVAISIFYLNAEIKKLYSELINTNNSVTAVVDFCLKKSETDSDIRKKITAEVVNNREAINDVVSKLNGLVDTCKDPPKNLN